MDATFSAKAGFLVATKWAGGIKSVERIRPHNTGTDFVCHGENATSLFSPDSSTEAVGGVVSFFNCFVWGSESKNTKNWPEYFLTSNAVRLGYVGENRWGEPKPLFGDCAVRAPTLRAFLLAAFGEFNDSVKLLA